MTTSPASTASELTFDAERHEYRCGGVRWPSVTQVCDYLQELDGIPVHYLQAAAAFGRNVHYACHLHNVGALDYGALDSELKPYVDAWRAFLKDTGAVVIASEKIVWNHRLQYAGTLDSKCIIRRRRELVDIKSTADMPRTVGPQVAAYAEADEPGIRRRVVRLKPDGTYDSQLLTKKTDFNLFLSALNVFNFKHRRGIYAD